MSYSSVPWNEVFALLLFLVIGVPACQREPGTADNAAWFFSNQCRPPCWNGISPGETQENEVIPTLMASETVSADSIVRSDGGRNHYDRFYEFGISDSPIHGVIGIIDGRVADIGFFRLEKNGSSGSLGITLGEAISTAGAPEYLVRADNWVQAEFIGEGFDTFVYLINTSVGFAFAYDEDKLPSSERGSVREEIEIDDIFFFSPPEFDKLMEMGFLNLYIRNESDFVDWIGYGEYPR